MTQFGAGLSEGLALGLTPYASIVERFATSAGVLSPGPKPTEFGKAVGEMVGGLALTVLGMGGEVLGFGLDLTGLGALVGVPVMAVSTALVAGGVGNMAAGLQGFAQALTTGSGSGSGGPVHHIATNKNWDSPARGGPWSPRFEKLFKKAGMSLDDAANKVAVPGHRGPHPEAYHEA